MRSYFASIISLVLFTLCVGYTWVQAGTPEIAPVVGIFAALVALLQRINEDRRALQRAQFAFRTLTHEIRSPIASMMFPIDQFRTQYDHLSPESQKSFFKLTSELQRLRQLVETSSNVLTEDQQGMISVNAKQIPSVNDFLGSLVERYEDKVVLNGLKEDRSFKTDPYWISICVKNLVENALKHGATPVQLHAGFNDGRLELYVIDAGKSGKMNFGKITSPFRKGVSSDGLGLGLNIVRNVVREMKGSFEYSPNPTTFVIKLREEIR